MKVVFRVDSSNRMGTGHLVRCMTLAQALCNWGADIRFICRAHTGSLLGLLYQQGIPVDVLANPDRVPGDADSDNYTAWLGVTQAEDARQTIAALDGESPDWLIVDHYGLSSDWEQRLRSHASNLMVIEDLTNRLHECDLLLNQNYSGDDKRRFRGVGPDTRRLLLGPRYALLRPEYAAHRRNLRARDGGVHRVLIFFGGSDPQNMTRMALEVLSAPEYCHLEIDIVVGANNPHKKVLKKICSARGHASLYGPRPHLADLIAESDFAIGAGGTTTWERMCLGLPSVVISLAENQKPACEALADEGLIQHLPGPDIRVSDLADAIAEWIGNPERLVNSATRSQLLVDGLGAPRVAERVSEHQRSGTHSALR